MPATRTLERRRRLAARRWRALHAGRTPVVYVGLGSCGMAAGAGEVDALLGAAAEPVALSEVHELSEEDVISLLKDTFDAEEVEES